MPGTKKQPVALHVALLEGLNTKLRPDGSVITIKDSTGKRTVAEACVGAQRTRVNFKDAPKSTLSKRLGKSTKSWPGGGVVLTAANAVAVRAALLAQAKASVPATPAPRKAAAPKRKTRSSRKAAAAA